MVNHKTIILMSGYMQSGKDSVGEILVLKYDFKRYAFADILKDEVSSLFGIPRDILDTSEGKETILWKENNTIITNKVLAHFMLLLGKAHKVRDILINHGQNRRAENITYWVEKVYDNIQSDFQNKTCTRAVITDWRFPNEYEFIENEINGKTSEIILQKWRVDRWDGPPLMNETEQALDDYEFDFLILNKKSLYHLEKSVIKILGLVPSVKHILLDIDDCLLDWIAGFKQYASKKGYCFTTSCPTDWDISTWIRKLAGASSPLTRQEIENLIKEFNGSDEFGELCPIYKAVETVDKLKKLGFKIIAISSCTADSLSVHRRKKNIRNVFNGNVDRVVCLPLHSSKESVLQEYSRSIFVDDRINNVSTAIKCNHEAFLFRKPWSVYLTENDLPRGAKIVDGWEDLMSLAIF